MYDSSNGIDDVRTGTICIEDIEVGMTRRLRKVIDNSDIEMFGRVPTDRNPGHFDDDYPRDTI